MRPNNEFTTTDNNCKLTQYWRKFFNSSPPWNGECIRHDLHYWIGGSAQDRLHADALLCRSVAHNGHPIIAFLLYFVVRIGGHPKLDFAWHWGYGHDCEHYHRTYCDRHHDSYVILEEQCKKLDINPTSIFGEKS